MQGYHATGLGLLFCSVETWYILIGSTFNVNWFVLRCGKIAQNAYEQIFKEDVLSLYWCKIII